MKPADKHTLQVFAGRTGTPYGKLLKEFRALTKIQQWKMLAEMREVEARFQEHLEQRRSGFWTRTMAGLKAAVLGAVVRR